MASIPVAASTLLVIALSLACIARDASATTTGTSASADGSAQSVPADFINESTASSPALPVDKQPGKTAWISVVWGA